MKDSELSDEEYSDVEDQTSRHRQVRSISTTDAVKSRNIEIREVVVTPERREQTYHAEATGMRTVNNHDDEKVSWKLKRMASSVDIPPVLLVVPGILVTMAQAVVMADAQTGNVLMVVGTPTREDTPEANRDLRPLTTTN